MQKVAKQPAKPPPKIKPPAVAPPKKKTEEKKSDKRRPMKATPATAWTKDWVYVDGDFHICAGNFSQAHKKYRANNQQGAAVCVVACAFCTLRKMNTWTSEIIDQILEVGTKLYLRSRQIGENRCLEHLKVSQIHKYFFVGVLKISMRLGVDTVSERITKDSMMLHKLEVLLEYFFQKYQSGVVSNFNTHFGIWKADKYYYFFDPNEHTRLGAKWKGLPGRGHSCCIRTERIEGRISSLILQNCPLKQINKFVIHPCSLEKLIQIDPTPPKSLDDVRPASLSIDIQDLVRNNLEPPKITEPVTKEAVGSTKVSTRKLSAQQEPNVEGVPSKTELPDEQPKPEKEIPEETVPIERPKLKSVTNFIELIPDTVGILRGSTHQRDPKFTKYLGEQSFANGLAALTMLRQHRSKHWVKKHVDDVLKLGEKIHHDLKKLGPGEMPKKITLNEIDYTPKVDKYGIIGRIESDDDAILNLPEALKNFLIDQDCCIVNGPNIVAVWKQDEKYYMFDPEERTLAGKKVEKGDDAGVACVTWWSRLDDLIKLYLSNLPKNSNKERFTLSMVKIKDFSPVAEDWYNFKGITLNKWILRGTISQGDRRFDAESRNVQCTANAAMALFYQGLKEEKDWTAETVDQVLFSGDDYYRCSVEHLKETGRYKAQFLMADELKRSFVAEKKKVTVEIDDCLVNGILNAKDNSGILSLKRGLEEFFSDSEAGIVTANDQTMAVWKKDNVYYYYDSHRRDAKGVVAPFGTACLLRMMTIEDLTNSLLLNFGANPQNLYNISRITLHLIDFGEDGVVQPPLKHYETITSSIGILRAEISCKDGKFELSAGKQEVPACLIAIGFNCLTPSASWDKEDLLEILERGSRHYEQNMADNYSEDVPEDSNVDEINSTNVNKKLNFNKNEITLNLEEVASGNIEDNLKEALETLGQREQGDFQSLLESTYMVVSMWRDENLYYLFDPRPRDEQGQVYGKEDWSVKIKTEEETEEVKAETDDENKDEDEPEKDELAGGDNLGEPEEEVNETKYEEEEPPDDEEKQNEEEEGEEGEEEANVVEKKGSDFWRAKESEGRACVMRFSRLEELINHIVENSPPNRRQEINFTLNGVKIESNIPLLHVVEPKGEEEEKKEGEEEEEKKEDKPEVKNKVIQGDWNNFKMFDSGRWILRGSRHFKDDLYPACNRGHQAIPMCIVALSLISSYEMDKFNTKIVDGMLAFGDRLYTVLRKVRIKELKKNKDLGLKDEEIEMILDGTRFELKDYPRKICIGEKMATWRTRLDVVEGDTTSKNSEVVPNLASGIATFFEYYVLGILVNRQYPVAIWKKDDMFYMFDPHPNGPSGNKSPIGVACITRFQEIEHLAQTFVNDLPKVGDHFFEIHALAVDCDKCDRQRQPEEEVERSPKIGGYSQVTAGKSILRGDVKLDFSKFNGGVNIQSAPIAFVALALSLNKDPEIWTRIIINEILAFGEELYDDTLMKLGDKFDPWSERLDVCKVNTDFMIGSLKVNTAIRFTEQRGIVDVKNSKTLNLRQGIEKFFVQNTHGILSADKFTLAIWEQVKGKNAYIYLFDPNSRGGTGLPGQGGFPCVMKFVNAKLASDHVMSCMMDIDKTKTEFSIVPIEIVVGSVRTKRKPCKCLHEGSTVSAATKLLVNTRTKMDTVTALGVDKPSKESDIIKAMTRAKHPCACKPCQSKSSRPPSSVRDKANTRCKRSPASTKGLKGERPGTDSTTGPSLKHTQVSNKPPTCPDKMTLLEEKRLLRKLAEAKRAKEEQRRNAALGRLEFYEVATNQALLRGERCVEKHRQLPVNLAAFIFMKLATDINKWTYKQIEIILEAGNQLYVDSYNAYKPPSPDLSLQHVLRRVILRDFCAKFEIRMPIIGKNFSKAYLSVHLNQFFILTNFCILNYENSLVSIYFKNGYYYLFDPYSRDLNGNPTVGGAAILMRFTDLSDLIDRILKSFKDPQEILQKKYALIVVIIQGVEKVPKATAQMNCEVSSSFLFN